MSKKSRTDLVLATASLPETVRLEDIQRSLQGSEELSPMQRRRLLKQFFQMKLRVRQEQFDAALEVEKDRLSRIKNVTKKQMIAQEEALTLHIREEAIKTFASLGLRVTLAQVEFLADFAEKLKGFRQKLAKRNIDAPEKRIIRKLSEDEFERVCNKLVELTEGLRNESKERGDG